MKKIYPFNAKQHISRNITLVLFALMVLYFFQGYSIKLIFISGALLLFGVLTDYHLNHKNRKELYLSDYGILIKKRGKVEVQFSFSEIEYFSYWSSGSGGLQLFKVKPQNHREIVFSYKLGRANRASLLVRAETIEMIKGLYDAQMHLHRNDVFEKKYTPIAYRPISSFFKK